MPAGRGSATGLSVGAVAVVFGSLLTWGTCPDSSCGGDGGLMVLVDRSGTEFGPGLITLGLGLLLLAIGMDAFRRGGSSPAWAAWAAALVFALTAIATVGFFFLRMYVFAFLLYGPGLGVYVVALGALVAMVAAIRLRPLHEADARQR